MKKITLIAFSILMVMALATPCTVSAVSRTWTTGVFDFSPTEGSLTYGLSNNVYLNYDVDTAEQNYGITSLHQAGNRTYATTNNTTLIYFQSKSTGATTDTVCTDGQTDFSSGWSAM